MGWTLLVLFGLVAGFYLWQPYRVQWIDKRPDPPPDHLPIEQLDLFRRGVKVMIVVGHPDDAAFYLGGTLMALRDAGASMLQVVCTDGDKGYYPFSDAESLRQVRRTEESEAAGICGIKEVVFLGMPDGRLTVSDVLLKRIQEEIDAFEPDFIVCNDPVFPFRVSHRDHLTAGEAALRSAANAGFRGTFLLFATQGPNTAADVTSRWPEVEQLLAIHKSQFYGEKLDRIRGFVKAYKQEAGMEFGPALADSFRACRLKAGGT